MADSVRDVYGAEIFDIPRQSSVCRILIYSHISDGTGGGKDEKGKESSKAVDCTRDVIQCQTSKTIKSGGGASFVLVPRRNYLNYIFPNDYVFIYFDPGDGRGFIMSFFGFVDRIERAITVNGDGTQTTVFNVTCSDFTKAFDKTQLYFNPSIVQRGDFVSQHFAGTKMIAGALLQTKGLTIKGNPADIVLTLAERLLGFSAQFAVPATFPVIDQALVTNARKTRFKNLLTVLPDDYGALDSPDQLEKLKKDATKELEQLTGRPASELTNALPENVIKDKKKTSAAEQDRIQTKWAAWMKMQRPEFTTVIQEGKSIMNPPGVKLTLLDLIDFRFVEYNAIDGSILSPQIWSSQGPLWSIMNSWSNDMVNELFCDLRPVGENENFDLQTGGYARRPDLLKENTGVTMVPAIVMREYPFSTVEGVKPTGSIILPGQKKLGPIALGGFGDEAVFAKGIGKTGRQVSKIEALNPLAASGVKAQKHLDTFAISIQDITNESIGRSDNDVVNLLEAYADTGIGEAAKYMFQDLIPICNPISVVRDGLRVRSYTTKFARWPTQLKMIEGVDGPGSRFQTIRWAMLLDHWYQHNREYLNGTFNLRAFPELRVGYRLDIKERNESYYIEAVSQNWKIDQSGTMLTTTVAVSRGQRNNPLPVYVMPPLKAWGGSNCRDDQSRLADCFRMKDVQATSASSLWYGDSSTSEQHLLDNETDLPGLNKNGKFNWGANEEAFVASGGTPITSSKDQTILQKALTKLREAFKFLEEAGGAAEKVGGSDT